MNRSRATKRLPSKAAPAQPILAEPLAPFWYTAEEIVRVTARGLAESRAQGLRWLNEGVNFLRAAQEHDDLARCLVEPATSIDVQWDTLIAAFIRYRLRTIGVDAPGWTYKKPLEKMWFVGKVTPYRIANAINLTPPELRRVGIFIPEVALGS